MASFSPWASSALLGGASRRLALAAGASALLWLAVLWASLGVQVPAVTSDPTPPPGPSRVAAIAPDPSPITAIAATGGAAPGGGAFDRFGLEMQTLAVPVNPDGDVAFFAKLMHSPAEEAVFFTHRGQTSLVAATGSAVPGGGTISSFTDHPAPSLGDDGTVAFTASIEAGRASDAVFAWRNARLSVVALAGSRIPGLPGAALFAFGPTTVSATGDVGFLATVRRGRETLDAICIARHGQLAKIVAAGDAAPGGGAFSGLGAPAINAKGDVAFAALLDGGPTQGGIFVANGGQIRRIAGAGDPAPGGGIFSRLSEHIGIDDTGHVAFAAYLGQGDARSGIFLAGPDDPITAIATVGAAAPGGGNFVSFAGAPSLAGDGRVTFFASVDGQGTSGGIYLSGPEGLARVSRIGDPVAAGGRIAYFPLDPTVSAGRGGRVTFQAGLERGDRRTDAILAYASPPR